MRFSCFPVLPDSTEAQVICGGTIKRLLIAYFIGNISTKKYKNVFTYVKVIANQRWDVFETQCMSVCLSSLIVLGCVCFMLYFLSFHIVLYLVCDLMLPYSLIIRPNDDDNNNNKSSAVAEMGDRGHNRHEPKRGGGLQCRFRRSWDPV